MSEPSDTPESDEFSSKTSALLHREKWVEQMQKVEKERNAALAKFAEVEDRNKRLKTWADNHVREVTDVRHQLRDALEWQKDTAAERDIALARVATLEQQLESRQPKD